MPKAYKKDDDFIWIIVELVRPLVTNWISHEARLKALDEFEQLSGVSWEEFNLLIKFDTNPKQIGNSKEFLTNIKHLIDTIGVGDMNLIEQWGKGSDGRLVYLDPGLGLMI